MWPESWKSFQVSVPMKIPQHPSDVGSGALQARHCIWEMSKAKLFDIRKSMQYLCRTHCHLDQPIYVIYILYIIFAVIISNFVIDS